jgi:hypothetical protein
MWGAPGWRPHDTTEYSRRVPRGVLALPRKSEVEHDTDFLESGTPADMGGGTQVGGHKSCNRCLSQKWSEAMPDLRRASVGGEAEHPSGGLVGQRVDGVGLAVGGDEPLELSPEVRRSSRKKAWASVWPAAQTVSLLPRKR